ncbi:hypothetical protein D3C73_1391090 [compost metagenome]
MMAYLMRDDVCHSEVARSLKLLPQLIVKAEINIELLVAWTIKRSYGFPGSPASGLDAVRV